MENSLAIANYFVKKSLDEGIELTPMKLLKLVYIAHGWYLGINDEPLVNEGVQAWKYGPVIPTVYQEFRGYGNSQIGKLAYDFDNGMQVVTLMPNKDKTDFLDKVWDVYKGYNGLQLSTLTHQIGTPWDIVWNNENGKLKSSAIIRNNLIEEHYKQKLAQSPNLERLN
ncbi:MAG: SocA family protein [Deinococcales bacterium]|nr:SocA family protein [Chitinophagaceae bacterium]